MKSEARVVLLTSGGLEHRYVANVLLQRFPEMEIIVEEAGRRSPKVILRRTLKRGLRVFFEKFGRILFLRISRDQRMRDSALLRHLGDSSEAGRRMEQGMVSTSINAPAVIARLRELKPNLVLVYGTGLVRQPVLDAASCTILNLHTGLSPYYRGVACYLWPLKEKDFDRVGVTIHDCVMQLDAGGILAAEVVGLEHGDQIHDVFARQVLKGGQIYAECAARELNGGVPRIPQQLDLGREFKGWELGLSAELRARRNLSRRWAARPTGGA